MARADAGPLRLLVVQPTPFCNLDCTYCYLPHRSSRGRMELETCALLARLIAASPLVPPEGLRVVWHGGEPLAAGVDRLTALSEILRDTVGDRFALRFGVQTNATLIDEQWLAHFRRFDVDVGVSLDGPRALHDAQRRHRSGRGSFDDAMRGIELLRHAGHPFDVIAVITRETFRFARDLIPFFRSIGARSVGFNVEEIEGANSGSTLDFPAVDAAMDRFWQAAVGSAESLDGVFPVREIDETLERIRFGGPRFDDQWVPLKILTCDWRGRLSTFSPELIGAAAPRFADFVFARLDRIGALEEMLDCEELQRAAREIEDGLAACRQDCRYHAACGGGMPANKFFEHGRMSGAETLACRLAIQAPVRLCLEFARSEAD